MENILIKIQRSRRACAQSYVEPSHATDSGNMAAIKQVNRAKPGKEGTGGGRSTRAGAVIKAATADPRR
jgi:hypothetical protein